ncbi:MAG TPA: aspartate aminotransferase family protein [Gemmatimonadaceae bacterium]|nr:aspartate aminotransferase family protein [Gemmatimonadaceae bacterium]
MSTQTTPTPPALGQPDARRDAPLRLPAEEFKRAGHALVDAIADFLAEQPGKPVTTGETPDEIARLVAADAPLPAEGTEPARLLAETSRLLFDHSLFNGHPKFFGYITSSPAHLGMLGDLLASAVNANVGSWRLGPVATEIEAQTVRWIGELLGYSPRGSAPAGLMVSGGNMANMVGLFAARAHAIGADVRRRGLDRAGRWRVYASRETHTWLQKATDLAGLGTDSISWVDTDREQRMDLDALRAAMVEDAALGQRPLMIVGTAGSVSTGAVDPLPELAAIARERGIWFHVDGAYGALAALVPGAPEALRGLALADSVAVDPHKWLYAPIEAGCVLVRDAALLRDAFSYHPPYYNFANEPLNFVDYGPQNSRGFRALKVWLQLRQVGRDGYLKMIGDDIALAQRLHARCAEHAELEAMTLGLSIATFRFVPADLRARAAEPEVAAYLDALNAQIVERLQRGGELFVSNAIVGGRYALRACIVNFNTTAGDVDAVPELVVRIGREVDGAERPARLIRSQ